MSSAFVSPAPHSFVQEGPLAPKDETVARQTSDAPTLTWHANRFRRAGAPTRILAGSLHYFRVHPDLWRDRLQRLVDLGLNTVDTYVPWNFHQPHADVAADFADWRDLPAFLRIAEEVGLDAIVRPGPYICAEWTNGGLPTWLTASGLPLRTADPAYLDAVDGWFGELLPRLTPLQANRGGNIIAMQVENEFGSYGDDANHVAEIARLLRAHGVTELLYTADGPTDLMLDAGTLPGTVAALTLGSQPAAARDLIRRRRPDEPFFVAEFWNGWFDHWGTPHHVRGTASAAHTLAGILEDGGSVSIYMAHGGTNFGLWSGANRVDGTLMATTTSYDSDAPIAEDGTLTAKFFAMRDALGASAPVRSTQPRFLEPRTLEATAATDVLTALASVATAEQPAGATSTFEGLGADDGFVLYTAEVALPDRDVRLVFEHAADRAYVFVDGEPVGEVEERGEITVRGRGRHATVVVLIENRGRVNYGSALGERKGMLGPVLVERRLIQNWTAAAIDPTTLDLDAIVRTGRADGSGGGRPGIASASFDIDGSVLDTHLALPGWGVGMIWVNGFLLGRFSEAGPQTTYYVPAPLLRTGTNEIVLLDLRRRGSRIELRAAAELGPEEEYVEEF